MPRGESTVASEHLTPTEFRIFKRLVAGCGSVVTHRMLEAAVWEDYPAVDLPTSIRKYVQRVRAKLSDDVMAPVWIMTIPRIGYSQSLPFSFC